MIEMSDVNQLLTINKVVLKKKILSIHEHYDLHTPKGKKLGEVDGNLIQIPVKFNLHDANDAEVMKIEENDNARIIIFFMIRKLITQVQQIFITKC